jgi:putrescine aminotransferase
MNTHDVFEGYRDRSWRFLADLQSQAGMEFVVGKREGPYLWNLEGDRRVLECGNSGGVHSLGHRNPEILATLLTALETLDAGMWTMPTAEALAFQDAIAACAPTPSICRSVLTLSSTDTIDLAIMFAFRVTGRRKALAYRYGYHGHSGFAALVTGSDVEGLIDHYHLPTEYSAFFPEYGSLDAIEQHLTEDCAAIILEPMNYETFQPAAPGFLEGVAEICRRRGALLIIDETRTGLSRSGKLWMTSNYAIEPDILILGKGLGAGLYPVSALLTTKQIYDTCLNAGHWGFMSSFAGSPIAAIIARKVVEIVQRQELLDNIARLEGDLTDAFAVLCDAFPDVYELAWVTGGIAALGVRDENVAAILKGELFKRNVLCHSISEISPWVVKFFPCLNSGASVPAAIAAALADFAKHYRGSVP